MDHPLLAFLQDDACKPVLGRLWEQPCAALAAYRALDTSGRTAVRRLLLVSDTVPFEDVRAWLAAGADADARARHSAGLVALRRIAVLEGRAGAVWLHPSFRDSLIAALSETQDGVSAAPDTRTRAVPSGPGGEAPVEESHDAWWKNNVLLPLVKGAGDAQLGAVFERAGLVAVRGPGRWDIGSAGFQFLLSGRRAQLWALLLAWLRAEPGDAVLVRLTGLLSLAVAAPGRPAQIADAATRAMARMIGLADARMCAAPVAQSLLAADRETDARRGYLVVETNYRLYAYTSCALEAATLALFVRVRGRFPDMIYGHITGPSVQAALARGITAAQIVAYLADHLHPCMFADADASRDPYLALPPVVQDQVHLWERERERLRTLPGVLYQQFADDDAHARAAAEASRLGVALYVNRPKRLLVVSEEGHPQMRQFLSRA